MRIPVTAVLQHSERRSRAGWARRGASRPAGWSSDMDMRLVAAIRSGRVTPAILRDFAADGWGCDQVLARCHALLAGEDISPLDRALTLLGPRVSPRLFYRDGCDFSLDGRKADAAAVVREANRGLANLDLAPIKYPGVAA